MDIDSRIISYKWNIYFHNDSFINRSEYDKYVCEKCKLKLFSLFSYQRINYCSDDVCEFDYLLLVDFSTNVSVEYVSSIFPEAYKVINDRSHLDCLSVRINSNQSS